jgi:proline iminopeptidase
LSPILHDKEGRIEINGIAHWYRIAGAVHATTSMIIVHGGPGGNVFNFERTIGPKIVAFASVIYYEQRGCGRSDSPKDPDDYSIPTLVTDLEMLRQSLRLDKIILLGFSFGGELALEYTLAYPQNVYNLIWQAPSIGGIERQACVQLYGFRAVAENEMAHRIKEIISKPDSLDDRLSKVWDTVDSKTVDRFLFQNSEMARRNRRLWEKSGLINTGLMHKALANQPMDIPLLDRIHTIQVPALVMVGLYDRNVGVEICRDVTTGIPQAHLVIFEHSAHFPDIEEPDKYAQVVWRFLFE